jgi:hypothetical protein
LDIVTNRAMSKSYIAVQPKDIKTRIKDDIKNIVECGDDKRWIDEDQGFFEYPYQTLLVVFHK